MSKGGRALVTGWTEWISNLLQESRFSNGTSRSTRQGAPFLILMFKITPRRRLILSRGRVTSPRHLTQNLVTDDPRAIKGTASRTRARDIFLSFFFFPFGGLPSLLGREVLTATAPRLAGDCGLNGTREFTWGPGRGWVTARRPDWPAVAVAAVTFVNRRRAFPSVRDVTASVYDDSLRVPRGAAMRPVDSFMHRYTGWPAEHRAASRALLPSPILRKHYSSGGRGGWTINKFICRNGILKRFLIPSAS